jgi:hypothetical protein
VGPGVTGDGVRPVGPGVAGLSVLEEGAPEGDVEGLAVGLVVGDLVVTVGDIVGVLVGPGVPAVQVVQTNKINVYIYSSAQRRVRSCMRTYGYTSTLDWSRGR